MLPQEFAKPPPRLILAASGAGVAGYWGWGYIKGLLEAGIEPDENYLISSHGLLVLFDFYDRNIREFEEDFVLPMSDRIRIRPWSYIFRRIVPTPLRKHIQDTFSSADVFKTSDGRTVITDPPLVDATGLADKIEELTKSKLVRDLNPKHNIFVGSYEDLKYHNLKEFPDMPLRDAIIATIAMPGLFRPVKYRNHILVDGGAIYSVPPIDKTSDDGNTTIISLRIPSAREKKYDFRGYLGLISQISLDMEIREREQMKDTILQKTGMRIELKTTALPHFLYVEPILKNVPAFKTELPMPDRKRLIAEGYSQFQEHLKYFRLSSA